MPYCRLISCKVKDLGIIKYYRAYQLQNQAFEDVKLKRDARLFLCEHPSVLTLGRLAEKNNILCEEDQLKEKGIDVLPVDRGGDVTFHGLGQLVVYPIFCLTDFGKDLKLFIFKIEQVVIDLLEYFGIVANRVSGHTGVWVREKKIASLGIGVRNWISYHGVALNVSTDLQFFSLIKPCGLKVKMTSMAEELKCNVEMSEVKKQIVKGFQNIFNMEIL